MKKIISIIVICLFAKVSIAQNNTYEGNANTMTNFASSGAPTAYGLTKSYVVNAGIFSDTSQANIVNYLKNYNGAQIMTYSGGVKYWLRYGGSWNQIGGSGTSGWALTGNAGTIAGTNFLGTTDATDFYLKTNSSNAARFYTTGNIDFWSGSTPAAPFDASSFKFLKDQDLRTDIHISNRTTGHNARAGVGGSNDRGNYFLLSIASDSFNVGVPGQENEWANKVVLQTGGNGKGLVISSNEGGMTFDVLPSDSTDTYIDFKEHAMVIAGAGRHGFVTPIAAGGAIGMGITAPRAKLDVYGKTLSDAVAPNYKKAFRVTAKMPTTVSSEFSAIEFNIDSANTTDKTIFEVKSTNNQVFRIDSANVSVNNKLGVGTISPYSGAKLHVVGSTPNNILGYFEGSATSGSNYGVDARSTGTGAFLNVGGTFTAANATTNYGIQISSPVAGANNYSIYANSNAKAYFEGSTGIGTSSPISKLHVIGSIRGTDSLILTGLTSGVGTKSMRYNPSTGIVTYADTTAGGGTTYSAGYGMTLSGSTFIADSSVLMNKAGNTFSTTTGTGHALISSTVTSGNLMSLTNTGTAAASNTKNVLAIVSSGANGTASQTVTGQTISVTNTGTTNTNVGLDVTASGATNNIAAKFNGGDVNIGAPLSTNALSTSSYKSLTINGPSGGRAAFQIGINNTSYGYIAAFPTADFGESSLTISSGASTQALLFYMGGLGELARFNQTTGNFGIGTGSTVSAKLHVLKTTEQLRLGYDASNYYSTTVGGTGAVVFDAIGAGSQFSFADNVGIGTTSPDSALTVNTSARIGTNLKVGNALTIAGNGAASQPTTSLTGTWFTGGSATTTKPQLLIEPAGTTSTAWNTAGTGLGINAASGFTGNLIDAQLAGVSKFKVTSGGLLTVVGNNGATDGAANFNSSNNDMSFNAGYYFRLRATGSNKVILGSGWNGSTTYTYAAGDFISGTTGAATSTLQSSGSFATAYVAKTANYTATSSDHTIEATSGTFTITLPTAVGITGRTYVLTNSGSGVVTISTTSSQTFVNVSATPTTLSVGQFNTVTVQSNGANWLRLTNL